jgi:hypothetical protein
MREYTKCCRLGRVRSDADSEKSDIVLSAFLHQSGLVGQCQAGATDGMPAALWGVRLTVPRGDDVNGGIVTDSKELGSNWFLAVLGDAVEIIGAGCAWCGREDVRLGHR